MLIRDIFEKDIRRTIDGVIKADDERHLANEVSEYVLTPDIRKHLHDLLVSYSAGGSINGVWISGFFGSGKSHLLKMISHLLENRSVDGVPVAKFSRKRRRTTTSSSVKSARPFASPRAASFSTSTRRLGPEAAEDESHPACLRECLQRAAWIRQNPRMGRRAGKRP